MNIIVTRFSKKYTTDSYFYYDNNVKKINLKNILLVHIIHRYQKEILLNNVKFLRAENYKKISSLILPQTALQSLEGIENLKNTLFFLDCNGNSIGDLKGIKDFAKLKYLDCSYNSLCDVDELKSSINLKYFDCSVNYIKNLDGVMNAKNMKFLNIFENHLTDMKWVTDFKKLKLLFAAVNEIENWNGIDNLRELRFLTIDHIHVGEACLKKLQYLINLEMLHIRSRHIKLTNVNFAIYMRNLKNFYASNLDLQNLNDIVHCEELEKIEINGSKKLYIFPNLLKLKKLSYMMLRNSPVLTHKGLPENITYYCDKNAVYCPEIFEPYVTIDLHEVSGTKKFMKILEESEYLKISWISWIFDKNSFNKLYEFF